MSAVYGFQKRPMVEVAFVTELIILNEKLTTRGTKDNWSRNVIIFTLVQIMFNNNTLPLKHVDLYLLDVSVSVNRNFCGMVSLFHTVTGVRTEQLSKKGAIAWTL